MSVTVTGDSSSGYTVTIKGKTYTLPPGSKKTVVGTGNRRHVQYGTADTYLDVQAVGLTIESVKPGSRSVVVGFEDGESAEEMVSSFEAAWDGAQPSGGRRSSRGSRFNVQRRRTQRYGRSRKHRKLRKLTTRRR